MAGRVGVILVHGIGEQKRLAHLESEIRGIIEGFRRRPSAKLSAEIIGGTGATYQADQYTWAAGADPSVRIIVQEPGETTEINVHEVWWADVNEPYSLAKQIRFWGWGLSVWNFPRSEDRPDLDAFGNAMLAPSLPSPSRWRRVRVRVQLFLAGLFFVVAAFSLGAAVFFAKRLFGFEAPDFVKVFVNYISGVKLYNQSTRGGSGFRGRHDFLDTLEDPPRVSIRRRMVQAIVAAAFREPGQEYDRWYILGHSLGSVVSLNGVMEYGQAFANYLPRETWDRLKAAGWAGRPRTSPLGGSPDWVQLPPGTMSPSRPVWLSDDELVYRDKVFENFRGLLTYGSPLGKFAELWPARVPVNKVEPIFKQEPERPTEWINVCDGRDPVSGPLKAFEPLLLSRAGVTDCHCPPLKTFGYAASPVLLLSHIRYLSARNEPQRLLTDVVADWIVSGGTFSPPAPGAGRWYDMPTFYRRVHWSWVWWIAAFLVLAALGTVTAMGLVELVATFVQGSWQWMTTFGNWAGF